jgi:hypothetical protein
MKAIKTKFEQVSLEQLKKILPDQVLDGNDNHNKKNQKNKKKDTRRVAQTSTAKSKV